jgi:hypothetical protein
VGVSVSNLFNLEVRNTHGFHFSEPKLNEQRIAQIKRIGRLNAKSSFSLVNRVCWGQRTDNQAGRMDKRRPIYDGHQHRFGARLFSEM